MLKCPACTRTGDDIGQCGSPLTCPKVGVEMDAAKGDILLRCNPCDLTRAVNASSLTKGTYQGLAFECPRDVCQCQAMSISPRLLGQDARSLTGHKATLVIADDLEEPAPKPPKGTTKRTPPAEA